ncbi:MAG: DnaJ domain-containing protein [Patescibacteria group bacterium]|jgi:DnaJ-class molecular chaperone
MSTDYYKTLGVSKSASAEEIKKAYRKLALEHHPDRGGGNNSDAKFKEVNEAYQVLSDPEKRKTYDQFGDAAFKNGGAGAGGFGGYRQGGFQGDFSDFDFSGFGFGGGIGDIFEDFFGAQMSQVQAELQISPAQAVLGDKVSVQINGENLEFSLPAGTNDGTSFRFQGKGRATRNGRKGDLILTIKIVMPKHLTKEQQELWQRLRDEESKKKGWWGA